MHGTGPLFKRVGVGEPVSVHHGSFQSAHCVSKIAFGVELFQCSRSLGQISHGQEMVSEPEYLQTFFFSPDETALYITLLLGVSEDVSERDMGLWVLPKIAPHLEDRVNDLIGLLSSWMPR